MLDFSLTEFGADRNDPNGFRELLFSRIRHYPVRIGMGLVIVGCQILTAWPHVSIWPPIWFAAILFIQTFETTLDRYLFAKYVIIPRSYIYFGSIRISYADDFLLMYS